jgi:hypothetical protein
MHRSHEEAERRHPERPRFHQRAEGSRVDKNHAVISTRLDAYPELPKSRQKGCPILGVLCERWLPDSER